MNASIVILAIVALGLLAYWIFGPKAPVFEVTGGPSDSLPPLTDNAWWLDMLSD